MKLVEIQQGKNLRNYGFSEKGIHYWWASWYANVLGYSSLASMKSTLRKAIRTGDYLGISIKDNFVKIKIDKKTDYKLTKFACLLIALHADKRKPQVQKAKTFFENEMKFMNINLFEDNLIERFMANETLTRMHKHLSKIATRSTVKNHQAFNNEGYKGLYNRTTSELRAYRRYLPLEDLSDKMSLTELLANMMRVNLTTTALKIKNAKSEKFATSIHHQIGKDIRALIKTSTGVYPEQLPRKTDLAKSKRQLKKILSTYNKYIDQQIQ